jgi:hypothetical protein
MSTEIQWLCFSTNPHRDRYGNQMAGRKLHAVKASDDETFGDIVDRRSLCGRWPAHGWTDDLFNEKKCARCLVALGIHCTACRGAGCWKCGNTGETREARCPT